MPDNVTCYGTGLIGSSWGANFLIKGAGVILYDLDEDKLAGARSRIASILDFFRQMGVIDDAQYTDCQRRARYTCDAEEAVRDAGFIQESGPENIAAKQSIIGVIEQYCKPDAIISSSTSGLLASDISARAVHPERILCGHPYNPVHLIPLVELVKGGHTAKAALDQAVAFYRSMGKEPVILNRELPGFIGNRIQMAVNREAFDLVHRGICTVEDADKAVVFGPGLRWGIIGPHLCGQLGGGRGGFQAMSRHIGVTTRLWLEDMAKWTETPENYAGDYAVPGIAAEMADRSPGQGQTDEALARYRDAGLVQLLKFHGKL